MKKFAALLLSIVLLTTVCFSALAVSITVDNATPGATYAGYRLLDLTTSTNADNTVNYAYTVPDKYRAALQSVTGKTTDADILAYISAITSDSAEMRTFADAMYAAVKTLAADITVPDSNAAQGYYLVEETIGSGDSESTTSLVMVNTAGQSALNLTLKKDKPTVEKKVYEDDTDSTIGWNDMADYDIGDSVRFKLTGTVDNYLANYDTYKYIFHDTLSAGLTFNSDVVCRVDSENGTVIDSSLYTVTHANGTLTIEFADLKQISGFTGANDIVVLYSATLNQSAVIGNPGNPNTVNLEYSNNPYHSGTGDNETGHTPDDVVVVFTFGVDVSKTDTTGNPLEGATFRLYADAACANEIKLENKAGVYYVNPAITEGALLTVGTNVVIRGLDADEAGTTYYLKEIDAPEGYNKLDAPVAILLKGSYAGDRNSYNGTAGTALIGFTASQNGTPIPAASATATNGSNANIAVQNSSGSILPSTGGMGTTLFIVGGVVLMAAAVVLLLLSRRKQAK